MNILERNYGGACNDESVRDSRAFFFRARHELTYVRGTVRDNVRIERGRE